jgi:hypothetical protein
LRVGRRAPLGFRFIDRLKVTEPRRTARAVPDIPIGSLGYPVQAFRPAAPDMTSRWDPRVIISAAGECAAVPLSPLRPKPLGQKPRAPDSGRGGRVHEVLVHVAFMARSSPVSASIAAHIDPPAVHPLRGLAHRDQQYPPPPHEEGSPCGGWGACASFSISFRLNMSRARIILQLPSSGWSEMELNVTVPWRWSRSPGLIRPTPPGVPGRGICARRPRLLGFPLGPVHPQPARSSISFIMAFCRLNRELLGSIGPHGLVRRAHHRPECIRRVWTHDVVHRDG